MADLSTRRGLLGALVALPVGLFIVSCSSSSSVDTTPGAPPQHVGTQTIYTSSVTNGHTHTFAIDDSAIASPPAAGVAGATSTAAGHAHAVSIAMADLQHIAAGQSVQITTTSEDHSHVFTFLKVA